MMTFLWFIFYPYVVIKNKNRQNKPEEWRNKFPTEEEFDIGIIPALLLDALITSIIMSVL